MTNSDNNSQVFIYNLKKGQLTNYTNKQMSTPFLFKTILKNQITTPSIHIPLVIFHGIPITIYLLQIPLKIKGLPLSFAFSTQKILSKTSSIILISIITLIVLIFSIIYLISLLIKINITNCFTFKALKHFILFCDLIVFRYLSSIILLIYSDLFIKCVLNQLSIGLICFSILSALFYIFAIYYHVYTTYIVIHVDNKEMIKKRITYPFDEYSKRFELYMLIVKIIGGVEYILSEVIKTDSVPYYMPYFFRYWFIILISFALIKFVIIDLLINQHTDFLLINLKFNLTRIGLVFFYIYILILMFLFINDSVQLTLISFSVVIVLSLVWTISTVILLWNKVIIPQLYNGKITIKKFSYLITRSNFPLLPTDKKKQIPFLYIDPIKILYSFKVNHFIHCVNDKLCNLCDLFYKDYTNTISYLNFYQNLLKHQAIELNTQGDFLLSSILSLIYYKFRSKPYKYYRHFQKKKMQIKNLDIQQPFVNYIDLIFESFINISNDNNNLILYNQITSLSSLNAMIHSLLESMRKFINLEEENDKFEGIIKLSSDLVELDKQAQLAYKSADNKGENDTNDQITKKIKTVYQYNIMINKYIIEKVLNKPLNSSIPLEPEQLRDYFTSHFDNDNFLMLSFKNRKFNLETIADLVIMKSGHTLINFEDQSFNSIIPSQLQYEANKLFIQLLREYNPEKETNQSFDFIICYDSANKTLSSFKYQFDLLHLMSNDSMLIYGFFTHPEKNIMLFESVQFDPNDLSLWRYTESIQSILFIPVQIIDIAKEMGIYFNMDELFTSIQEIEIDRNDDNDNNANENSTDTLLECIFNYKEYCNILLHLSMKFTMIYSSKDNALNAQLINAINQAKKEGNEQIKFRLKLMYDYHSIKAYSVNVLSLNNNVYNTSQINQNNNNDQGMKDSNVQGSKRSQNINNNDYNGNDNNLVDFNNMSISSMADNHSINSIASSINNRREAQLQLITVYNPSVNDIMKDNIIKMHSKIIIKIVLFLNIFIIVLCVLLLFIQIVQLNSLFTFNSLFIQFKQLRILFSHVLLNIYSNVCIGVENSDDCINHYIDYSRQLLLQMNDPSLIENDKYYVSNFVNYEIKYKLASMVSLFSKNKADIFAKGDKDLIEILNQNMNYSHIVYQDNILTIQKYVNTFEQGFKNCFNSIQIIQSHPEFINAHKMFILEYNGSSYNFDKIGSQVLDQVQIELYRLIINFLNFSNVFRKADNILLEKIQHTKTLNGFILGISIGTIFSFNLLLFIFCLYEFKLTHQLLNGFCIEIITFIFNNKVRDFFSHRIDNLLIINKLYEKNPNGLISDITKKEQAQQKKSKKIVQKGQTFLAYNSKKSSSTEKHSNSTDNDDSNKQKKNGDNSSSSNEMNENSIYKLIKFYTKISSYIFYCFFLFFIIFAYFVYISYLKVLNLVNYVQLNYFFENNIYTAIGMVQIMILLSMNDADIAKELGYNPNSLEEQILIVKNREIFYNFDMINNLEVNDPNNIPDVSDYFTNSSDCGSIILQTNDSNINLLSNEMNVNYTKLVAEVCKIFNVASLKKFTYLYNDIMLKVENLQNVLNNISYSQLMAKKNLKELFDMYTISLLAFRPIRFFIKSMMFTTRITTKMNDFVTIVAVFLSVNILFTVSIFIINKWYVFKKLHIFNKSLCSLKKSLLM